MIRLKALNDSDDSDDEDVPTITKEALVFELYFILYIIYNI